MRLVYIILFNESEILETQEQENVLVFSCEKQISLSKREKLKGKMRKRMEKEKDGGVKE